MFLVHPGSKNEVTEGNNFRFCFLGKGEMTYVNA